MVLGLRQASSALEPRAGAVVVGPEHIRPVRGTTQDREAGGGEVLGASEVQKEGGIWQRSHAQSEDEGGGAHHSFIGASVHALR